LSSVEWDIRIGHAGLQCRRRQAGLSLRGWQRSERTGNSAYAPAERPDAAPWQPALAALAGQLGPERDPGAVARVVLADSMVRYAAVPWHAALANADEESVFLRHRFAQLYDSETANWDIRIDRAHGERARMASAVDPALIAALGQLLGARGMRLRALVPALADTANRHLSALAEPAGWLVRHDAGSLAVARWEDGAWLWARSFRVGPDWRTVLPALLAREECLHDGRADPAVVCLAADGDDDRAAAQPAPAPLPGCPIRMLGASARPREAA
jgi:hypothetical protein